MYVTCMLKCFVDSNLTDKYDDGFHNHSVRNGEGFSLHHMKLCTIVAYIKR